MQISDKAKEMWAVIQQVGSEYKALHSLLLELYSGRIPTEAARKDFEGRDLVATPFGGAYGHAGWIIAVNGSPPRGVIVCLETKDHKYVPASIFYLEVDKSRRLGSAQADIVRAFVDKLAAC